MDIRVRPAPTPDPDPSEPKETMNLAHEKPHKRLRSRWHKALAGVLILLGLFFGFFAVKVLLATKDIITTNIGGGAAALFGGELKGEDDGRINILVIGIGGEGHEGPNLADTVMLVSVDPKAKTASMLSIPRDFYLKTPGNGWSKINAVNAYGDDRKVKGGGAALMKQAVSDVTGVPVHYYLKVDFTGFKQIIDAVGGIDVTVENAIHDPSYPADRGTGFRPLRIKAGRQHMNGDLALRYARSRHNILNPATASDFDRAKRQQKVIMATREKALSAGTLANPAKLASIIDAVGDHVRTDLKLWEMKKLLGIVKDINSSKTQTKVLDPTSGVVSVGSESLGAGYILVPTAGAGNYTKVRAWVRSYLTNSYIASEAAKVSVYNGTATAGLAAEVADFLKSYGYNVTVTANAPAAQTATTLYDYTGGKKPYTLKFLANRFKVSAQTRPAAEATDQAEIQLIIGADFKRSSIAED
jgi:polyisoprenyl-teichoic acid--peptidoglycan teichoic acid transferase